VNPPVKHIGNISIALLALDSDRPRIDTGLDHIRLHHRHGLLRYLKRQDIDAAFLGTRETDGDETRGKRARRRGARRRRMGELLMCGKDGFERG
jgi:hypothetical protein